LIQQFLGDFSSTTGEEKYINFTKREKEEIQLPIFCISFDYLHRKHKRFDCYLLETMKCHYLPSESDIQSHIFVFCDAARGLP
jgi:hypothetical protein